MIEKRKEKIKIKTVNDEQAIIIILLIVTIIIKN